MQHIKPTSIELPPISYVQEMGGSSYVDGCNLCLNVDIEKAGKPVKFFPYQHFYEHWHE